MEDKPTVKEEEKENTKAKLSISTKIISTLVLYCILFFFPSPQQNFIVYLPTLIGFIILTIIIWRKY